MINNFTEKFTIFSWAIYCHVISFPRLRSEVSKWFWFFYRYALVYLGAVLSGKIRVRNRTRQTLFLFFFYTLFRLSNTAKTIIIVGVTTQINSFKKAENPPRMVSLYFSVLRFARNQKINKAQRTHSSFLYYHIFKNIVGICLLW